MEYKKDLKNFKDLDDLLGEDYIYGNYDLSKAILEKTASLLVKNSVTILNKPFKYVYLVHNEKLEKKIQGINKFIDNLKADSLGYLCLLIGRDFYMLNSNNYDMSVVTKELKNEGLIYFWDHKELNDKEIDFIENIKEDKELKKERLNRVLELNKMADSDYLAYQIKKRSEAFLNEEELSNVYKKFSEKPLFIMDKKEIYSIEYKDNVAQLSKHNANDDKYSLMIGMINSKYNDNMYE
ncbi:MAG: hypothetical protein ACP5MV_01670 [Candidatus Parvarchaeum sp.]